MKISLFENKEKADGNLNCIEFFGLSRSGKTHLLKKLIKKGKKGVLNKEGEKLGKIGLFIKHFLRNPWKTNYLFYKLNTNWVGLDRKIDFFKVFLMRNSYLMGVLGKYESVRKRKGEFFVDEFLLQSIFIILQKKSNENEIKKVLKYLPRTNKILLVESEEEKRYKRIGKTRFPGQQINKKYSVEWMKNSEFNYKIIKKILLEDYGPVVENPKVN